MPKTFYVLKEKDLKDIKKVISGYCFGGNDYVAYIKIYYNCFWKFPKTFRFTDYEEANKLYFSIQKLI